MKAEQLTLSASATAALKAFRDSKPWRGSLDQRREKFETFHAALCEATGLTPELVLLEVERDAGVVTGGNGGYSGRRNTIVLAGKLSVVTYLFAFGLLAGLDGRDEAMKWARGLFKHFFPRSAAGCVEVGGLMLRRPPTEVTEDEA